MVVGVNIRTLGLRKEIELMAKRKKYIKKLESELTRSFVEKVAFETRKNIVDRAKYRLTGPTGKLVNSVTYWNVGPRGEVRVRAFHDGVDYAPIVEYGRGPIVKYPGHMVIPSRFGPIRTHYVRPAQPMYYFRDAVIVSKEYFRDLVKMRLRDLKTGRFV